MDLILKPYRVATSKPAQKTYLNTLLFLITSSILLGLAVIAYILFYLNYVPQIGIERVIHLQYGDAPHPYALTPLTPTLISHQPYDISLSLHLPRSPPNLSAGNFMLSLTLLSSNHDPSVTHLISPEHTLFTSRRPAILPYTSPLISLSSQIVALPLYIWGWKREEERLEVEMGELVTFPKGWKNIPAWTLLEVEAGNDGIQTYDVRIKFKARFSGVRWLMYNHRLLSFVVGVCMFWSAECIFTLLAFVGIQTYFAPKSIKQGESKSAIDGQTKAEIEDRDEEVKEEETDDEPDLSDTPRTFPTYGRQAPLRYEPKVKDEESEEEVLEETAIQPLEADDEESGEEVEDGGGMGIDSGIGTSFSEGGVGAGGVARRRSRGGKA